MVVNVKEELYVPERIQRMKDALLKSVRSVDIDRIKYYTRSYKKTEGQLPAIRAAKGLEETLTNMRIRIDDDMLIVGVRSAKYMGAPVYIEAGTGASSLQLVLKKTTASVPIELLMAEGDPGSGTLTLDKVPKLSEEELAMVTEEILPYWRGKTSGDLIRKRNKEEGVRDDWLTEVLDRRATRDTQVDIFPPIQGHITVGLEKVLRLGFRGIARQADEYLAKLDKNDADYLKKKDFLDAVKVSANAVCIFGNRFADLAEHMAKTVTFQRRQELLDMAERCRRVPAEPPRNFKEAIQSMYLTQISVLIAYGDPSITCPGRVDQYLYPTYKKDIEAGRITREEALEWIMEYNVRVAETFNGPNCFTVGGVDRKGNDAVNEVSYLFLEAIRNLKGLRNSVAVRVAENTPHEFVKAACEVHRYTSGLLFFSDPVVIRDLMQFDGLSLEDARDYGNVGCAETTGCGNNNGYTAAAAMHAIALLEMALNEGGLAVSGYKRVGAPTPAVNTFKSIEDVKKAFAEQMGYSIKNSVRRIEVRDRTITENYPVPLLSSTIEGCVESATDFTGGGAKYRHAAIGNQGLATQADSLTAIRWAVFDKKLLTMEELVTHLRNNFKGAEEVRQQLLNAPKYGNDDPYADEMALWVAQTFCNELKKYKYWQDGVIRGCLISSAGQTLEGSYCGASADGRLARTPVSNGVSPTNQMERNGMTAAMRSGAFASRAPLSDGSIFNMIINPLTLKTDEQLEKFTAAVEAYLTLGGRQIQFNPVSKETLLDAQKNPQNYPELMVKVSGFSARFTDLSLGLQNDIIKRTEFTSC